MKKTSTLLAALSLTITYAQGIETQDRDDAGASGASVKSGFYQTFNPVNFPAVAVSSQWWHLLDIRHTNTGNNYAMQFSGNFSDQNLFFRKTDNNPAQPWHRVVMEKPDGKVVLGFGTTDWSKFTVNGNHINTSLLMHANNNTYPHGYLSLWASEPGVTYSGVGVGNNIRHYDDVASFTRINNNQGASYIRLLENEINFNIVSSGGVKKTPFTIHTNGNASLQGKFEATEVKVTTTPTADFVFEENYKLPTLEEVEKHIKENKHLPEVSSAKEMEKNGVNIGEFQIRLLQKIEELTLYSIEQNKKINFLIEENRKQTKKTEKLEAK